MISSLEIVMARAFPQISNQLGNLVPFPSTDFEPLLDSKEAAALLRIYPKTLKPR
jgi:hypothetical protein